jgi:hypothetical protein
VKRYGRSLLRQASVLLLLGCAGMLAGPALAEGPAPDPAPPRTNAPKPEPPSTRREPARQTTTPTSTTPRAPRQATQPTAPPASPPAPPPAPTQSFTPQPVPVAPPAPAPVQPAPQQAQKPKPVKKKAGTGSSRPRVKQALPRVAPAAASQPSSPDNLLLIGGVALVILVLGDTIFLGFSVRFLREAR